MSAPPSNPGPVRAWLLAARPATLTTTLAPVLVGSACAATVGGFRWAPALMALLGGVLIQIGTNFANDVLDFEKGADTEERLGPTRAVQAGWISPRHMRWGMFAAFGGALLCGLYLTAVAGWPIFALGLISIACGIAYTGGPLPLAYYGLGDLFVILFFGFAAVVGTAYVQLLEIPEIAWWASIPPGALATCILVINNLRDRSTDVEVNKRTLAVRFGAGFARGEYIGLLLISYLAVILVVVRELAGPWALLPLLTLPLALRASLRILKLEGRALNPLFKTTAGLLMLFCLLFALGLRLGAP
ncbi:MAG: 1,4-dihydroxy-2-naphthoate polyprenyltransferase [Acidobacteriota bacterium]